MAALGAAFGPVLGIRLLEIVEVLHNLVVIHAEVQVIEPSRRGRRRWLLLRGLLYQQLLVVLIAVRRRARRVGRRRGEHRVADHCGALYLARTRPFASRIRIPAAYLLKNVLKV